MHVEHVSGNDGFALVDALIASVILSVAIASLAQLIVGAAAANAAAGRATIAALLAADKLEELRAASPSATGGATEDMPRPGFTREWFISDPSSHPHRISVIQVLVRTSGNEIRMVAVGPRPAP